jgi:2-hydroxychromene-2-carboxylate isomerase
VIAAAARRAGLDPPRMAEAVVAPEIKEAVRATHDEALSFGVFGVPTVLVGEQLFWGDDQLQAAADAASGV